MPVFHGKDSDSQNRPDTHKKNANPGITNTRIGITKTNVNKEK
jgi:hypothetical protein